MGVGVDEGCKGVKKKETERKEANYDCQYDTPYDWLDS